MMLLFINMIVGAIGMILVALGAFKYRVIDDHTGFLVAGFGVILTFSYIYYLEKKAGISKKAMWMKAMISLLIFLIISSLLYF